MLLQGLRIAFAGLLTAAALSIASAQQLAASNRSPTPAIHRTATPLTSIWRSLSLGAFRDVEQLRAALRAAGVKVGTLAEQLLAPPGFSLSREATHVDLVALSPADLGLAAGGTLAEVHARARSLGFELCDPEVGPLLRLSYLDQPLGEFLSIAMLPNAARTEGPSTLTLGNGGAGLLLISGTARPDAVFPPTVRFVFVRPANARSEFAARASR